MKRRQFLTALGCGAATACVPLSALSLVRDDMLFGEFSSYRFVESPAQSYYGIVHPSWNLIDADLRSMGAVTVYETRYLT